MKRALRDRGLSLVLVTLFVVCLTAQSLTGWQVYNESQQEHGEAPIAYAAYLRTGHFVEVTFENWESEFLQMALYVVLTAFLFQRGSSESKDPDQKEPVDERPENHRDDPEAPWPVRHGGWPLKVYKNSLSVAFGLLFLLSFAGHAAGGFAEYNEDRMSHGEAPVAFAGYLGHPQFWFESFQNWQSEFLAVFSIVVLSIQLRQQGSPESKPVHAPHRETGS